MLSLLFLPSDSVPFRCSGRVLPSSLPFLCLLPFTPSLRVSPPPSLRPILSFSLIVSFPRFPRPRFSFRSLEATSWLVVTSAVNGSVPRLYPRELALSLLPPSSLSFSRPVLGVARRYTEGERVPPRVTGNGLKDTGNSRAPVGRHRQRRQSGRCGRPGLWTSPAFPHVPPITYSRSPIS